MADSNHCILIRIKNAAELARSQGAVASFAQGMLPAWAETQVYETAVDKLKTALADEHVDADISIVEPKMFQPANGASTIGSDLAYGIGLFGFVALLWSFFGHGDKK